MDRVYTIARQTLGVRLVGKPGSTRKATYGPYICYRVKKREINSSWQRCLGLWTSSGTGKDLKRKKHKKGKKKMQNAGRRDYKGQIEQAATDSETIQLQHSR